MSDSLDLDALQAQFDAATARADGGVHITMDVSDRIPAARVP